MYDVKIPGVFYYLVMYQQKKCGTDLNENKFHTHFKTVFQIFNNKASSLYKYDVRGKYLPHSNKLNFKVK